MTAAHRLSIPAALALAEATLAARGEAEVILSACADDDGLAAGYGLPGLPSPVGPGPLLVDLRTGETRFLGSIEQLDRIAAMHEVTLAATRALGDLPDLDA